MCLHMPQLLGALLNLFICWICMKWMKPLLCAKKGSIKQAIETGLTVLLKEYWSSFCISLALQEEKKLSGKQSRFLNFHQLINPCDFEFTSCYWTDFSQGGYKIGIKSAGSFRGEIVILMRLREYSLHGVCFSTLKLPLWSEMLCTDIYC